MKLNALLAATALASLSTMASAAVYTDVHDAVDFGSEFIYLKAGSAQASYTNTFNILDEGYQVGDGIISAAVTFWIRDDNNGAVDQVEGEVISFLLDSTLVNSFSGLLPYGSGLGMALTSPIGVSLIATLESSGMLTYTVTALEGDFRLKGAQLTAETPDGAATISLLGLGLLGIAALRRKVMA